MFWLIKMPTSCDLYANVGFFNSSLVFYFSFSSNNSISVVKVERNNKYLGVYQVMIPCNYTINSISKIRRYGFFKHFVKSRSLVPAISWEIIIVLSCNRSDL